MNNAVLFSSAREEWATPQSLFDELHAEFDFTLDAAASASNAKCDTYYTVADDALRKTWTGRVWLNPPYGRGVGDWIRKAYESVYIDKTAELVVVLPASRTDTKWWHDFVWDDAAHQPRPGVEIRFIRGRLRFGDGTSPAPFPSVVIVMQRPLHG